MPFPFISASHRNYCASLSSAEYTSNRRWSTASLHRRSQAAKGRASCMLQCFTNLFFLLFGEKVNVGDPEQIKKKHVHRRLGRSLRSVQWVQAGCFCCWAEGVRICGGAGAGGSRRAAGPWARTSCCRQGLSCRYHRDAAPAHTWQDLPLAL